MVQNLNGKRSDVRELKEKYIYRRNRWTFRWTTYFQNHISMLEHEIIGTPVKISVRIFITPETRNHL